MRVVRLLSSFDRDWKAIPKSIQEEVRLKLPLLQEHPQHRHLDTKKLRDISPPTWRWRIGRFRILYRYDDAAIYLIRFLDRKDAYK